MEIPFELHVAWRYLLAKRKQAFISLISLISTIGVAVGVTALVIALALMTGLQGELRDRILGSSAHVCSRGSRVRFICCSLVDLEASPDHAVPGEALEHAPSCFANRADVACASSGR